MAQVATAGQKTTMRSKGQWSKLYAAIFFPHTVYSAQLAAVPSTTDMIASITYTGGSGTLADVLPDMTLWVGTSAGDYDLGMCRIRKAPIAGTFYIGEQSKVDWQADCYLTVVDDFDLKAKHIHISSGVAQMDYDVDYSDQHEDFNPVPVLGPNRIAKLEDATVDVQLGPESGYASWVIDSTISSYAWDIPDATAIDDDTAADPVATFDSVGWHLAYCVVTAANGKTKRGVRYVYIWDDDNPPFQVVSPPTWEESRDDGGCNFSISLANNADLSQIHDRALCILFSVDYYDSYSTGSVDSVGPIAGAENIEGIGRIVGESITYDGEKSVVSFDVYGYQEWFKQIPGFPSGLEIATNTPDAWTSMPALTVDRFLWHFLEWRCTATTIMDVILTDDDLYAAELSSLSSDLWSQMEEIATTTIFASLGIDRYGRFFAEIEPQMVPEADRDWVTVMDLTDADHWDETKIDRVIVSEVAKVEFSGVGVTLYGAGTAYFSLSPGHVPGDYGTLNVDDRYLVGDQDDSNQKAGLLYGWVTNKYKPITMNLLNNKMLSCFPRQFIGFTMNAGDTIRGDSFDGNLIPRRIRMNYNPQTGFKYYEAEFEAETFEQVSVNGDVPGGDAETGIPPLPAFPKLPDLPFVIYSDTSNEPEGPPVVLLLDDTYGILYTTNFNEEDGANVKWKFWNTGIATADVPYIGEADTNLNVLFVTPNGAVYVAVWEKTYERWWDKIYRAPSIGAKFELIIDQDWVDDNLGAGAQISGISYDRQKPETIGFIARASAAYVGLFVYGNPTDGWNISSSITMGTDRTAQILTGGDNKWVFDTLKYSDGYSLMTRLDEGGVYENSVAVGATDFHVRAGSSPILYIFSNGGALFYRSEDNGDTFDTDSISGGYVFGPHMAISNDGTQLMGSWDAAGGRRGKSSDGGYTWSGLPNLPYGDYYPFAFCGGSGVESRWIAARGVIRYSDDFGDTWYNKEGNINYLIPVSMNIVKIVVPGFPS